jgi:hypothetical protein
MLLTRHGLVNRLAIICAIRDEAGDLAVDLLEQSGNFADVVRIILSQSVRNDFTGVRVDRKMELAPSAMAAVSLLVPLALSEQLQPRAVDNQMSSSRNNTRSPCRKLTATSAECGVVRNAEIEPQQAKHAAGECLSLTQGKALPSLLALEVATSCRPSGGPT